MPDETRPWAGAATYDPLGKVVASTGVIGSLGFQSEWTDAVTSRVNMHARWYNTDTGQFDTRDTASNGPVPDSIAANRYQYGDGTPLTTIDPTGHWGNPFKAAAKAVSKATSKVSSATRRAVSSVSSYSSAAYQKAKTVTKAAAVKTKVKKTVSVVKDAANATKKWVVEHKDTILEVAAIAGAVVAGLACTAVTAGVGAVACMVGAGALINLAKDVAQGDIHPVGDALGSLTTGVYQSWQRVPTHLVAQAPVPQVISPRGCPG
ncbi:RHS repeat-associated core domain-containing protein [Solwaraspora sp. WMMA2056]|nr:RHS repeat-associated core domain-containing protein [Solwaraspora sp. WMMA2056]WJK43973.1 RHS repeat-associated core domain-containing protein [Solwaraspora sp. WMMA2056]